MQYLPLLVGGQLGNCTQGVVAREDTAQAHWLSLHPVHTTLSPELHLDVVGAELPRVGIVLLFIVSRDSPKADTEVAYP